MWSQHMSFTAAQMGSEASHPRQPSLHGLRHGNAHLYHMLMTSSKCETHREGLR
jgi:hypothetical protein